MWNPLAKIKEKFGRKGEKDRAPTAKPQEQAVADLKDLEKKGLLGQFFRHWKSPAFMKQLKVMAGRMQAEGVNVKDSKAVKKWLEEHKSEIESGEIKPAEPAVHVRTFVKKEPAVGRNAPCTCGSGKKYKKCCGK